MIIKEGWWFLIGMATLGITGYSVVIIRELVKLTN